MRDCDGVSCEECVKVPRFKSKLLGKRRMERTLDSRLAGDLGPDSAHVLLVSAGSRAAIGDVWSDMAMFPGWAQAVSTPEAVSRILGLASDVLAGLNIETDKLSTTSPDDLVFYWRKLYTDHFLLVPPRHAPDIPDLAVEVARNIAGGSYSMHQQSRRYRDYLNNGHPAGFPVFPEYVGDAGLKTEHISWDRIATTCSYARSLEFQSKMAKLPRRPQSLRSSSHGISDVQNPSHFV